MITGIDFSFSRVPPAVAKAAGHRFAVSYLTDLDTAHRVKAWTAAEVAAYRAAGLGVVAVWQGGGSDRTTAWRNGYDRGRRDAQLAARQSGALGRPEGAAGRPVYFAIDSDVSAADLSLVARYFDGVASVFDLQNIGVYGGRRVIEWAQSSGKARWFWQTGAWSGGVRVPGVHLFQRIPPTKLAGHDVDIDEALAADYGQWFDVPGGAVVPSKPAWVSPPRVTRAQLGWPASAAAEISREQYGSKIHYLGTRYQFSDHSHCAGYVRSLRESHLNHPTENYSDIAYSELVCEHGVRFEGRGYFKRTGANGNASLNNTHYAICALLGSEGSTVPTDAQLHGLRDAIEAYRQYGGAGLEIRGHRDGYATSCPGGPLYAWVQAGAPRPATPGPGPAPDPEPVPVEEDMPVIHGDLHPGYDPEMVTVVVPPTVPPGKRGFVNIGAGYVPVLVRVDAWAGGRWHFVGEGFAGGAVDGSPAFWALPDGTRKLHVKRVKPADALPEFADEVAAIEFELSANTPAAWNVEVV